MAPVFRDVQAFWDRVKMHIDTSPWAQKPIMDYPISSLVIQIAVLSKQGKIGTSLEELTVEEIDDLVDFIQREMDLSQYVRDCIMSYYNLRAGEK